MRAAKTVLLLLFAQKRPLKSYKLASASNGFNIELLVSVEWWSGSILLASSATKRLYPKIILSYPVPDSLTPTAGRDTTTVPVSPLQLRTSSELSKGFQLCEKLFPICIH